MQFTHSSDNTRSRLPEDCVSPEQELAELLGTEAGLKTSRLLAHVGLIPSSLPTECERETSTDKLEPIGPWLPMLEGGEPAFVREFQSGLDAIWWRPTFEREVLRRKQAGDAPRLCLIGESAAAGMFYTPHYTPAIALAESLPSLDPASRYEVLDFTRNSMNAAEVVRTVRAALQLAPDVVVVYAGNNWFSGQSIRWDGDSHHRRDFVQALSTQGLSGAVRVFQHRVKEVARATVAELSALVRGSATRLIMVVPAVNLLWERAEPPVWLGGGRTTRWYTCHARVTEALSRGELTVARESAEQMLLLDEGTCPTTHRLLGKIWLALNQLEQAANAFELELEHANAFELVCQPIPGMPRYAREQVAASCREYEIGCVDLPGLFAAHTGSSLLWSKLFIDYCHLSPEGMRVAMAGVARTVVQARSEVGEASAQAAPQLAPKVTAVARFYASIYTGHMMRSALAFDATETQHAIAAAVRDCAELAELARDYLRARNGALVANPTLSRAGCRVLMQSNNPFLDYAAVRGGSVDALTIEAIAAALDANQSGSGQAAVEEYLEFYRQQLDKGIDLTEPVYIERLATVLPYLRYESERETRRALPFFRAMSPDSSFTLVAAERDSVRVIATWRVGWLSAGAEASVVVAVNGQPCSKASVGASWSRHTFNLPAGSLKSGCNRITVHWPELSIDDDARVEEARRRYLLGQRADLFPIFGEIFSLRCRRNLEAANRRGLAQQDPREYAFCGEQQRADSL